MVEIQLCSEDVLQKSVLCKGIFVSCRDVGAGRDTALHPRPGAAEGFDLFSSRELVPIFALLLTVS